MIESNVNIMFCTVTKLGQGRWGQIREWVLSVGSLNLEEALAVPLRTRPLI